MIRKAKKHRFQWVFLQILFGLLLGMLTVDVGCRAGNALFGDDTVQLNVSSVEGE